MAGRLRLGVIGTSDWAELMYFNNLRNRDDVETVGIAGRNPARLAEIASKYGIAETYRDYRRPSGKSSVNRCAQCSANAVLPTPAVPDNAEMTTAVGSASLASSASS